MELKNHVLYISKEDLDENFELKNPDFVCGKDIVQVVLNPPLAWPDMEGTKWFRCVSSQWPLDKIQPDHYSFSEIEKNVLNDFKEATQREILASMEDKASERQHKERLMKLANHASHIWDGAMETIKKEKKRFESFMQGDTWEPPTGGSIKNDRKDGKPRWELLPLELVEELVKVYTFGAEKYSENSWQNLPDGYRRYKAALFRHILAYEKGEINDPESGLKHLAHAAWNALALIYFSEHKK